MGAATGLCASVLGVAPALGAQPSLPGNAYEAWCRTSHLCTYTAASPAGLGDLQANRVGWIGADEALTAHQLQAAGGPVSYYPTMLTGIAVVANVPGITGHHLRLTDQALAGIFDGSITNWNAGAIRATNRNHHLPSSLVITRCVPRGASGDALDFTQFLAKASPAFRARMGAGSSRPTWLVRAVRIPKVQMTSECLGDNPGGVAFLPIGDAVREHLADQVVAVGVKGKVNHPGRNGKANWRTEWVFTHPSDAAIQKAGQYVGTHLKGTTVTVDLTRTPAAGAYPITVEGYAITRRDRKMTPAARKAIAYFMSPTAQGMLQGMGYTAVPPALLAKARAQLAEAP